MIFIKNKTNGQIYVLQNLLPYSFPNKNSLLVTPILSVQHIARWAL